MSLIQTVEECNAKKRACFVSYITAGDPDLKNSAKILEILALNGVDIIELGIPFSDPISDGPTIQKATERSLKNNVNIDDSLKLIEDFRLKYQTPIILFGYFNPFLQYGLKKVMKSIKKSGGNGVLIVDLPPEEAEETQNAVNEAGIELVYLLAPTSTEKRIKMVSKLSNSFIYLVSVTGVTGARRTLDVNLKKFIAKVRKKTKKPVCVGFGISKPEHVNELKKLSNGIVIGSAIIKIIENNLKNKLNISKKIGNFVKKIKKATNY